ncbi:MAG TPA: hypothetical protein VFD49_22800 [Candidatus Dormibacteraeota bacterium]|nr:hypothetical protein [Candidatus Dormibacteraeota bacterium]
MTRVVVDEGLWILALEAESGPNRPQGERAQAQQLAAATVGQGCLLITADGRLPSALRQSGIPKAYGLVVLNVDEARLRFVTGDRPGPPRRRHPAPGPSGSP